MKNTYKNIACIFVFLLSCTASYSREFQANRDEDVECFEPIESSLARSNTKTYTTTISSENQQIVKGLGGGLPWPQASSGFPVTNHPEGMKILLDMGISVARVYWHNQFMMFDKNGDPTTRGQTMIDGFIEEIRWLNKNNIPYNMDGGINNMPRECYFNDKATGHLLPEYELAQVKATINVLKAIRNAGLKMPLVVTPFNEPSAPVNNSAGPTTGSMPRDQCVRISKLLRAEMNKAGFNDVLLGYSENGQPMYANWYAGSDIGHTNGVYSNVFNGEKNWPFFNNASKNYDADLDVAVGAFTTHSYWPSVRDINEYVAGYNLTNRGRDNWMTEYCLWGGDYAKIDENYNQELLRKFISDMVFFKFNYWEFWNIWNISSRAPCTDILCGGNDDLNRKPAAYYALAKIFKNITPGKTYVKRLTTDVPDLTVTDAVAMNAAAFVSPDKTVVVLVNSSSDETATTLKGLYGKSAQIFQIDGSNNELFDTDMALINTPRITDGMIDFINMPRNTITIIITDGGYGKTYTTTVSSVNQQTVKGLGGGMPWPSGNTFSITNHPVGQQKILDLGISVARIFWQNQGDMFDEFGVPTTKGFNMVNGFIEEIRWLSQKKISYNLAPGFNTLNSVVCYFQEGFGPDGRPHGELKQEYEDELVEALMYVLRRIREADLPLPIMVTPFNEPNCPVNQSNAPVTGKMPVEQVVRIFKKMKRTMFDEGFGGVELGYCDAGSVHYACEYLGNYHLWDGKKHTLKDERWPFVNPASEQYDAELDNAIDCFVYHGYYAGNDFLQPYMNGFEACNDGRDHWQTEYCYWHEDRGTGEAGIKRDYDTGMMSRFISDMAYLKANFWEMWIMWRNGTPPASDAMFTNNFNPPAYYAFQKIFKNITPGTTKVRRVTTDVPGVQDQDHQYMNTVAFVSEEKTMVVIVNGSDDAFETSVKGLYGGKAEVWQIETGQETAPGKDYENNPRYNKPMTLINTAGITDGTVKSVKLAAHTITIIVTDGGEM